MQTLWTEQTPNIGKNFGQPVRIGEGTSYQAIEKPVSYTGAALQNTPSIKLSNNGIERAVPTNIPTTPAPAAKWMAKQTAVANPLKPVVSNQGAVPQTAQITPAPQTPSKNWISPSTLFNPEAQAYQGHRGFRLQNMLSNLWKGYQNSVFNAEPTFNMYGR